MAAGESVPDMNRCFARPPYDAFDNGIQAKFACGLRNARKQVERYRPIAIGEAKGMIAVDLVGGGRIRSQGMYADDLLAGGIEAFHVTGRPALSFFRVHRIGNKLGEI